MGHRRGSRGTSVWSPLRLLGCTLLIVLALTSCSPSDDGGDTTEAATDSTPLDDDTAPSSTESDNTEPETTLSETTTTVAVTEPSITTTTTLPPVETMEGSGPSTWNDMRAIRVDEVSFDNGRLEIVATVAARGELEFDDEDFRIVTNSGIELPTAEPQIRTMGSYSQAELMVAADGITEPIRSVEAEMLNASFTLDVPDEGRTYRWNPAPHRQVGFTDGLLRDANVMALVPFTFRTEGLISELTLMGISKSSTAPELCTGYQDCLIEDSEGRPYHQMGGGFKFSEPAGSRVFATIRFLGPIISDETNFLVTLGGYSGFLTIPDPEYEYSFQLPTAEETSLSVSATSNQPEPFNVGETVGNDNLQIQLKRMEFFEDRIQLNVTASASDATGWSLNFAGDTLLRDPSGYEHPLADPAGGGDMSVGAGDTVDATLVFLTPLDVSSNQLHLELAVADEQVIEYTIDLSISGRGGSGGDGNEGGGG